MFTERAAEILDRLLGEAEWGELPYRLTAIFVRWVMPRLDDEVLGGWLDVVRGRPREGWLRGLIARVRG